MRSRPGEDDPALPTDYYELLEIPKDASASDIKKAYRRLALKYHPDKNPDDQAKSEKRFKKIAEAYEILSDDDKRRTYDQFGKQGVFRGDNSSQSGPHSSFHSSANFRSTHHKFNFNDPRDIFSQVFGDRDPFANFFNNSFNRRSHSRPRSAFAGSVFDDLFDDFDIFFNSGSSSPASSRSERSHSSSSNSSTGGSERTGDSGEFSDMSDDHDSDDDIFTTVHDRLFNGVHARNIHSNLWNANGFNFQTSHSSRSAGSHGRSSPPDNMKSTTTSTKYVDGKKVVTKRVIERGVETTTVEEDGFLTSRIVTYL